MPTDDEVGLRDEVLARIPVYADQEIHLRLRTIAEPAIPPFLEWSQYNLQDGRYYLCTPVPCEDRIIVKMIEALVAARERL